MIRRKPDKRQNKEKANRAAIRRDMRIYVIDRKLVKYEEDKKMILFA